MITLKIREAGHTVAIPGLKTFRTPADIDISKLDIRIISMYLKTSGITNYKIVAESDQGHKEIYTRKDFDMIENKKPIKQDVKMTKRIDKIEKILETLVIREAGKTSTEKEQNNKLDRLEKLIKKQNTKTIFVSNESTKVDGDDPEIEELDSFIPDVDVSEMKIKSDIKTIKQETDDLEDAADMLSGLTKNR